MCFKQLGLATLAHTPLAVMRSIQAPLSITMTIRALAHRDFSQIHSEADQIWIT
jgi:phage FluMu protein gp41